MSVIHISHTPSTLWIRLGPNSMSVGICGIVSHQGLGCQSYLETSKSLGPAETSGALGHHCSKILAGGGLLMPLSLQTGSVMAGEDGSQRGAAGRGKDDLVRRTGSLGCGCSGLIFELVLPEEGMVWMW